MKTVEVAHCRNANQEMAFRAKEAWQQLKAGKPLKRLLSEEDGESSHLLLLKLLEISVSEAKTAQRRKACKLVLVLFGEISITVFQVYILISSGVVSRAISKTVVQTAYTDGVLQNITVLVPTPDLPFTFGPDAWVVNTLYSTTLVTTFTSFFALSRLLPRRILPSEELNFAIRIASYSLIILPAICISYCFADPWIGLLVGLSPLYAVFIGHVLLFASIILGCMKDGDAVGGDAYEVRELCTFVLFQSYDIVKDVAVLVVIPAMSQSDIVYVATAVDAALSIYMLFELWVDSKWAKRFTLSYVITILQYLVYSSTILLCPSILSAAMFSSLGALSVWLCHHGERKWRRVLLTAWAAILVMVVEKRALEMEEERNHQCSQSSVPHVNSHIEG